MGVIKLFLNCIRIKDFILILKMVCYMDVINFFKMVNVILNII